MRSRDSQARHPRLARAALVVGTSRVAARRASGTGGFGLRLLHLDATPVLRHLLVGLKRAGIERAVITLDVKSNALAASLQADPMLAGASSTSARHALRRLTHARRPLGMKLEFCTVTGSGAQSGLATLRASSVVNAASHFCANEPILLVANQLYDPARL